MKHAFKPLLLVSTLALVLSGCGESTSYDAGTGHDVSKGQPDTGTPTTPTDPSAPQFSEKQLLVSLTDNVFTPTFNEFDSKSDALPSILSAYCDLEVKYDPSLQDSEALAQLTTAKLNAHNAWKEAMVSWQHAELMIVGPLLENDKSLRNDIYSWPNASTCSVDQDVVFFENGTINGNAYDISKRSDKRRGLDALEYLLFNDDLVHSCSSTSAGEVLADWNTRSEQMRKASRCRYAVEVSKDLSVSSDKLVAQWSGTSGYASVLQNAGEAGNKFASTNKAINEISDALFYMTEELKDYKLATPLGLFNNECGGITCPESVESKYAKHSIENIRANLNAFELLFNGGGASNLGFDDFLDNQQASDTKTAMLQGILNSKEASQAITTSLQTALESNTATVTDTHAKVKDVTDQLKNDFITKLALELPATSAGDND
ncbi:imelysin family protein [Pseudoalteromonas sp. MMG005]|uniref:imelysin family protein n=1 Tax=Pseudoalteromonas sp. MMG005 TaxID=2822682 RepID=UPI001B3A68E1|nr:imelysin family protein [Pseudoalteromonas sp. MMG005]MBQ4846220.1 imelysin family protein [Pseudoalteromonas sp. MMG005]